MSVKKLGFGLMRLPLTDPDNESSIDMELMKQMGFAPMVVNINTLVIAMPVATYGTILCLKYGKDTTMITEVTFITTLASMITIPLLVTLLF